MLAELWRLFKANFSKRLAIYTLVVMSLMFFGTMPSLFVRLLFFFLFIVAAGLFLVIFGRLFLLPGVLFILAYKKSRSTQIPDEIVFLKNQMGINVKKLRIVEGLCNAYVIGGSVVLGKKLLEKLSPAETLSVIAHEFAHKKGKHILLRFAVMILFLVVVLLSWSKLNSPILFTEPFTQILLTVMVNIGILAFILLVMIVPNWILEFKADRIAAKFTGKENIKSALLKLVNKEDYEEPSETHPSIAERVKHIDKVFARCARITIGEKRIYIAIVLVLVIIGAFAVVFICSDYMRKPSTNDLRIIHKSYFFHPLLKQDIGGGDYMYDWTVSIKISNVGSNNVDGAELVVELKKDNLTINSSSTSFSLQAGWETKESVIIQAKESECWPGENCILVATIYLGSEVLDQFNTSW